MSYQALESTFYRLAQLDHAEAMLGWDQHVMMPAGGNPARSRALAELSVMRTELLQDPALNDRFAAAREDTGLSDWQRANLRQMTLQWKQARALPKSLVEARSLASSECEHAWRSLRPDNDWAAFEPMLQRVFGLARELMGLLGFDFGSGRLDETVHPFSGGVPEDTRVATRYDEHNVVEGLMAIIHETGHSRYETGLPRDWLGQPVGQAMGMGVHESQSLFFEMQLGRSRPFVNAIAPLVRKHLGSDAAFDSRNLHALYTRVAPGKIRVNADEVTYPMHIVLRYELERDIILGDARVGDIPDRWNAAMEDHLGIDTRGDYRDGPMQDIHWPMGAIGYFPSYTLGALNAAQLHQAMVRALPDVADSIERLELAPVFDWLSENVWRKGRFLEYDDLMRQATGETLNPDYFLRHVEARYLG